MSSSAYVLITAAHNEEEYIEETLRAIVSQVVQPLRWIIVSDASNDKTDEIVRNYAREHPFINLLRHDGAHQHSFAAKAQCIGVGYKLQGGLDYGFLGILDADVSPPPDYYSTLIGLFRKDPALGLAGGFIYEKPMGVFECRPSNRPWSVAGAAQFFRRECFEDVGGVQPLPYGGIDWRCEVSARMLGWSVKAVPELKLLHYRLTGAANHTLVSRYKEGKKDYSLGSHSLFEVIKCLGRMADKPRITGGIARLAGFTWACWTREKRSVSKEFVRFVRSEQKQRMISILSRRPARLGQTSTGAQAAKADIHG